MIQRSQRLGCGAKLCCCDYQNRIVSHVSSSVPKMQLPTYLSIDDMIRTRSFQQNSENYYHSKFCRGWFAAIFTQYIKTVVSHPNSSNLSNTSGTALSNRSSCPRFESRDAPAQQTSKKNARVCVSPNWVNGPYATPPLLRPEDIIFASGA